MALANPTPAPSPNTHLDTTQSMLNLIFIQCGRFVKEVQSNNGTGRQRLAMQRAIPIATERMHDALDELENEVRLAQTVLRRDLALLRQDRRRKEAEAVAMAARQQEAEKARLAAAAEKRSADAAATTPVAPIVKSEAAALKTEKVSTPAGGEGAVPAEKPAAPAATAQDGKPEAKKQNDVTSAPAPPQALNTTITADPERDPLFDGTPTTANAQDTEFDFDAIFGGDGMDASGGGDMMDTSADLPFSLDDSNEGPSLLRGLEDFAKSGGGDDADTSAANTMDIDFSMPDLPDLNAGPAASTSTPAEQPTKATEQHPAATVQKEETKDADAAAAAAQKEEEEEAKDADAPADIDVMATTATDDLEYLFNMDDLQPQENSSFDDAFFNFE